VPFNATPNISYLWHPPPVTGQGSPNVSYVFKHSGEQSFKVWAIQAGKALSLTHTFQVLPGKVFLYFPLVLR
jgi:hypothetical protein